MGQFPSSIEKKLLDTYIIVFEPIFGLREATNTVKGYIEQAKKNAKESGRDRFPLNYGDTMLRKYSIDEKIKNRIDELKKEGVKDEDIRNWWNMHYLEREMILLVDKHFRLVGLINSLKKFGDKDIASQDVRKYFPIYGNYKNTSTTTGDDKPLPSELKDRVNKYMERKQNQDPYRTKFKRMIKSFTSFNALIRSEIRNGDL